MKPLLPFLFLAISAVVFSQAPQNIPYQAVVRNTDGSTMANAAVTITFKIHDNSATGTVGYEETHATITNAQGLVSLLKAPPKDHRGDGIRVNRDQVRKRFDKALSGQTPAAAWAQKNEPLRPQASAKLKLGLPIR